VADKEKGKRDEYAHIGNFTTITIYFYTENVGQGITRLCLD